MGRDLRSRGDSGIAEYLNDESRLYSLREGRGGRCLLAALLLLRTADVFKRGASS